MDEMKERFKSLASKPIKKVRTLHTCHTPCTHSHDNRPTCPLGSADLSSSPLHPFTLWPPSLLLSALLGGGGACT